MIQRIQSIFLAMSIILLLLTSVFIFRNEQFNTSNIMYLFSFGLPIVAAVINVISILFFKNRGMQVKLAIGSIVVVFVAIILMLLSNLIWEEVIWSAFAIFGNVMAIRAIKKDDNLVRESNRLR